MARKVRQFCFKNQMILHIYDTKKEDFTKVDLKTEYLAAKRALFDKVYRESLNDRQCEAVFTAVGPLLVLAGAGTGKTTVLVNRISYLIKYGNAYNSDFVPEEVSEERVERLRSAVRLSAEEILPMLSDFAENTTPPYSVLAITFTNKAAREIKDRLASILADEAVSSSIWAGTFHSVCLRILRRYGERVGYREGFSVYDTDDKRRMISLCMKDLGIDEKRLAPRAVASLISMAKDSLVLPEDYEITSDPRSKDVKEIYTLYQKNMMRNNALDFDDIIMKTVELLRDNGEVRAYYQNKFRQVLVDEYQDTNYAQFVLTKLLADKYRNIMVVGDDDQSIYRFRGATVENILNFDKTYPDAAVVKLEENYRSTGNILSAANAVIKNNELRHSKSLWSSKCEGEKITLHEAEDGIFEGKYIVDRIAASIFKGKRKYSDFAVLYRINALGRSLQTAFAKAGVPFKVVGDLGFYDRKEIKDMLAYLSVVASSDDALRLKRIINEPKRKIGAATVEAIESIGAASGLSMLTVIERCSEYKALSKSREKLLEFSELIKRVRESFSLPSEMLRAIFIDSGYRDMLAAEGFEGETKIENVEELISAAAEYESKCAEADILPTLSSFLEEIALVSDIDKYDESADAVVLMTVHSAKGLEFPVVFLAGMEDGIFPSEQNIGDSEQMSEERRLAYVAITRAKDELYITRAKTRVMYGKTVYNRLSSFVRDEIPERLLNFERPKNEYRGDFGYERRRTGTAYSERVSDEFRRAPGVLGSSGGDKPAGFGIRKLAPGTRVMHSIFNTGTIISAKDLGGDVLYTVRFDTGEEKRLMATFAKLKTI